MCKHAVHMGPTLVPERPISIDPKNTVSQQNSSRPEWVAIIQLDPLPTKFPFGSHIDEYLGCNFPGKIPHGAHLCVLSGL